MFWARLFHFEDDRTTHIFRMARVFRAFEFFPALTRVLESHFAPFSADEMLPDPFSVGATAASSTMAVAYCCMQFAELRLLLGCCKQNDSGSSVYVLSAFICVYNSLPDVFMLSGKVAQSVLNICQHRLFNLEQPILTVVCGFSSSFKYLISDVLCFCLGSFISKITTRSTCSG